MKPVKRHPRSTHVDLALDRLVVAMVRECNSAQALAISSLDCKNIMFWHTQAQKSLDMVRISRSRVAAALESVEDHWGHRLGLPALVSRP